MEHAKRRLLWHGMLLFLLGMLTAFVEQQFKNPRMGLAAHLQGVMNGTFLLALGAVWTEVRLLPRWKAAAFWSALFGTYAGWLSAVLAAIFGTGARAPITAKGFSAPPLQEGVVTFIAISVALTMICSALLVLWGLRRKATT